MTLSQRDVAAREVRKKFIAVEQEKQDAAEKAKRDARKEELRSYFTKLSIYRENTSHLPSQHRRTREPGFEFRVGDETLLTELNEEFMRELNPLTPAQVEAEAEAAYMVRSKEAAQAFTTAEPLYYKCKENFQIMADYVLSHKLPADSVDSWHEAFTKTRAQQKQRPQPSAEQRADEYFTKVVHRAEGRDFTAADLDKLSADDYGRIMRVPKRAPLGSLLRPVSR
jgi:hypothetical protein